MPNQREAVDQAVADVDFASNNYQILLETTAGEIRLDLEPDQAPGHCKNMIGLAKIGFYDGLIFHRVIDGFMIQGGCPEGSGTGNPGYSIPAEFNTMPHVDGTLSMARSRDPNSAGSQFFICLGRQASLDGQYTAFGQTADDPSYAVVKTIGATECGPGDRPKTDMKIIKATVITEPK